jgi:hypothetical protein
MVDIVLVSSSAGEKRLSLPTGEITVGRLEGVGILLPSNLVSRLHAKFQIEGGVVHVTDLASRNGTYVNGDKIESNKPVRLVPGDRIRFAEPSQEYIIHGNVLSNSTLPAKVVNSVFISYRRDDSGDITGRLYDRLVAAYGADNVFKDVDSIPLGANFPAVLREAVGRCQVLLAVIGRDWLRITGPTGLRRLDDLGDFIRLEIEAALQRGIPVIPVLVSGAAIPPADQLPAPLQPLVVRHGIEVRRDPDFHHDVDRLLRRLNQLLGPPTQPPPPASASNTECDEQQENGKEDELEAKVEDHRHELQASIWARTRDAYEGLWNKLEDIHLRLRGSPSGKSGNPLLHSLLREANEYIIRNSLYLDNALQPEVNRGVT